MTSNAGSRQMHVLQAGQKIGGLRIAQNVLKLCNDAPPAVAALEPLLDDGAICGGMQRLVLENGKGQGLRCYAVVSAGMTVFDRAWIQGLQIHVIPVTIFVVLSLCAHHKRLVVMQISLLKDGDAHHARCKCINY